jgi:hypothetical protein
MAVLVVIPPITTSFASQAVSQDLKARTLPSVAGFLLAHTYSLATMASQEFGGICDGTFAER